MQVERVEAIPLKRELDHRFANAQKWISSREYCLVRITTADGTSGWGECWGPIAGNREIIDTVVAPWLIGQDIRTVESIHDELRYLLTTKYHSFCPASVVSGIDIALWDLYGKSTGQSVSCLLGGRVRDEIQAYATGHFWPPVDDFEELREAVVSEAEHHVRSGFDALKNKIGLARNLGWGPEKDVELVGAIREAVGDDVRLMADANHAYDVADAIRVAEALTEFDVYFLEEPIPPEHIDQYARVNRHTSVSLAGGECWAFANEFDRVLDAGAVDYVQPDVTSAGGVTSTRRIITAAEAQNVQPLPHVFGSAVALAASLQLLSTVRGAPMLEFDRTPNPLRDNLIDRPISNDGNTVVIPDTPGIGIEIDESVLEEYRID
ncbi:MULTISPECIES: mandelate racemase/muconate lactonizing enzyme family protein [unclassified Haladaptatus]|uniref:mandelate racemase/muconate lactonizing enzyme family protein n=1 Tax=unclassified Haladaptatus TaxID=2622732 RepID=UPI0023E78846|nr:MULTISPECIES: mandelate racemase/muconate lactonizing enzyme family protein [unclassified Haladaptatus]